MLGQDTDALYSQQLENSQNDDNVKSMMHVIVQCPRCFRHTMAKKGQKTRQCPYCGTRIPVAKHTKAQAPDGVTASKLVRQFNDKTKKMGLDRWAK